jgi:hypothetical protein
LATGKLTALSFGVAADDWNVLQTARPNVLLIGSDQAVAGFLPLLLPLLQPPITDCPNGTLTLPAALSGTLILRDVQRLVAGDQQRVSVWMAESARRTQVISTAPAQLYPLVERQVLSEPLFYCLNVITIALSNPVASV